MPGLWENCQFLNYGRLFPMHMNALVYGWAIQAGVGVMLWLMARLTRVEVQNATTIVVAGHVWNFGVFIAVLAIWFGFGRSIPWLDFPSWLWPMLGLTYLMMLVWLVPMFQARRTGQIYISELFVIGAALWFPWIFATANLVIDDAGSAVMGAGVNAWYITNLIYFWFAPVALAVAYYLIPKIAGRPIYSYPMARFGFWALAILAGWTGFNRFCRWSVPGLDAGDRRRCIHLDSSGGDCHRRESTPHFEGTGKIVGIQSGVAIHDVWQPDVCRLWSAFRVVGIFQLRQIAPVQPFPRRPRHPGGLRIFLDDNVRGDLLHHPASHSL